MVLTSLCVHLEGPSSFRPFWSMDIQTVTFFPLTAFSTRARAMVDLLAKDDCMREVLEVCEMRWKTAHPPFPTLNSFSDANIHPNTCPINPCVGCC